MDAAAREKFLADVDEYLNEKNANLDYVLQTLGWDRERVIESKHCCSANEGHWVPDSSLSRHERICKYVQEGYLKEDLLKNEQDSSLFYEKASNVVNVPIDSTRLETVLAEKSLLLPGQSKPLDVPQTEDRWTVQLTLDQRLAMYDHVVKVAKEMNKLNCVPIDELMIDFDKKDEHSSDKPKSKIELLAEMRDYKRRRQSYRAKNVHTTKKSYTEIMREVIGNQMSYLEEIIKENQSEKSKDEDRYNSHSATPKDASDSNDSLSKQSISKIQETEPVSRKRHHSQEDSFDKHKSHKKHKKRHSRSPSRHKHKKHKHR